MANDSLVLSGRHSPLLFQILPDQFTEFLADFPICPASQMPSMVAGQAIDPRVLHDPAATPKRRIHAVLATGGRNASITLWALAMEIVQVP